MDYTQYDNNIYNKNIHPQATNLEQNILGELLKNNSALNYIYDKLFPSDFYQKEHQIIYENISFLIKHNKTVDVVTLTEFLKEKKLLDDIGGMEYIISLAQNTLSPINIARYAEIIKHKSIKRQILNACQNIYQEVIESEEESPNNLLEFAEKKIFELAKQSENSKKGLQKANVIMSEVNSKIAELYTNKNNSTSNLTGIETGFIDLDKYTSGLQAGDLIIIAGRPSMGKTAFAINIAENVAAISRNNKAVAIFSMEMGADQLILRMLSSIAEIDQFHLKTGKMTETDWKAYSDAMQIIAESKIYIDDTGGLNSFEIKTRCRKLATELKGDLGLIIIDYLQLMLSDNNKRFDNRTLELAEISRSLKALAKELKIPIIALSQLSRGVENRSDKRPMMSDLRDSGSIEQDADLIIFLYRDSYYNKNSEDEYYNKQAEAIISKHRNGPTGTIHLTFDSNFTKFRSAVKNLEDYSNNYPEYG